MFIQKMFKCHIIVSKKIIIVESFIFFKNPVNQIIYLHLVREKLSASRNKKQNEKEKKRNTRMVVNCVHNTDTRLFVCNEAWRFVRPNELELSQVHYFPHFRFALLVINNDRDKNE